MKAEYKIEETMSATGCDRETAIAYLDAEEWIVTDAVISILGDRRLGRK